MHRRTATLLTTLAALALFIWLRDLRWTDAAGDTLPILAGLPIFFWLGWPWRLRTAPLPLDVKHVALAAVLVVTGIALDLCLPLALGCTALLAATIGASCEPPATHWRRWLVLPLLAFPWIALDGAALGWWFRLSGAWAADHVLTLGGLDVVRAGTQLYVGRFCIDVGETCSGLNMLQAMLIGGAVLAVLLLERHRAFWWSLPVLFAAAWLANVLRIVFTGLVGVQIDPRLAEGALHTAQGWVLLVLMFGLCWALFSALERCPSSRETTP